MHIWCEFNVGLHFGSKLGFGVVLIFNCASDQQVKEHRLSILKKQVHPCTDGWLKVTQNAQNSVLQGLNIQNWDVCLLKIPVKHVFH